VGLASNGVDRRIRLLHRINQIYRPGNLCTVFAVVEDEDGDLLTRFGQRSFTVHEKPMDCPVGLDDTELSVFSQRKRILSN
jgi:hypothetical protein